MRICNCCPAATAVIACLFLGAFPAVARAVSGSSGEPASGCKQAARIDTAAEALRADGFTAQAAKNFAYLTYRDHADRLSR
jgi:hypothetical protein